jgi:hypothetical protein
MSRVKKILVAASVLLGLEFLSLAVFLGTSLAGSNHYVPALMPAVRFIDAGPVRLDLPVKNAGSFAFECDGETTPDPGCFLPGTKPARVFFRSHAAAPACFKVVLTPKISRCISKSVLIL